MSKKNSEFVNNIQITKPAYMEYYVNVSTPKDMKKYIDRIKKIIRGSKEYRDYIQFLKENVGLDSCAFFQNVNNGKSKKGRISIEMHHEPFSLHDYVEVVLTKYMDLGLPLNDLMIADEVLQLHYENKVGLVPVSKTMHQIVHNSSKIAIPLHMCYGNYSKFLEEYDEFIDKDDRENNLYDKLEKKLDMTKNMTDESFEAIMKEFKYLEVDGFDDVNKMTLSNSDVA